MISISTLNLHLYEDVKPKTRGSAFCIKTDKRCVYKLYFRCEPSNISDSGIVRKTPYLS